MPETPKTPARTPRSAKQKTTPTAEATALKAKVKAASKQKPAPKTADVRKTASAPRPKPAAPTASAPANTSPEAQVAAAASALVSVVSTALSIRKKELVERVVAASGAKRKQVKEIVEHTLKALGDALARGEELNLPPLGKAKVNRSRDSDGGTTMMVKIRQGGDKAEARKAARKGAKALAEPKD